MAVAPLFGAPARNRFGTVMRLRSTFPGNDPRRSQSAEDPRNAFVYGKSTGIEQQVRFIRRLIGRRDARHVLDLAGGCLRVQALGIAAFHFLEATVDMDLEELAL